MMKLFKYLAALILLTSQVTLAQTSLQPYHWTWAYLDYLKTTGYLPSLNLTDRPWQDEDILQALKAIDLTRLSPKDAAMVQILKNEFSDEPLIKIKTEDATGQINAGMFSIINAGKPTVDDKYRTDFEAHPFIRAQFGNHLFLYANYKLFNHPRPLYIGKKFRNLYAYEEQGYLYFRSKYAKVKIGRDYLQTGPGRSGQLLFSDNSRPFDQYQFQIGFNNIYLKFYGIQLDKRMVPSSDPNYGGQVARRFINGHGLYVNIKNKYFFNINEIALYGGPNINWQLALMNPLNLYYGETANGPFETANSFYDLNFDLYLPYRLNLYGDLLIDDFQVDKKEPGDLEPNEIGLLIGGNWTNPFNWALSRINLEYVQIRNRTYNAPVLDWEKFVHRNEVIGYYLGNDLKAWYASVGKWWNAKFLTKLYVQRILKGEGSVLGEFNKDYLNYTVKEGYNEAFPWGTVEKTFKSGIKLQYHLQRQFQLFTRLDYQWFNNYEHQNGVTKKGLTFLIGIWGEF